MYNRICVARKVPAEFPSVGMGRTRKSGPRLRTGKISISVSCPSVWKFERDADGRECCTLEFTLKIVVVSACRLFTCLQHTRAVIVDGAWVTATFVETSNWPIANFAITYKNLTINNEMNSILFPKVLFIKCGPV